MKDLKNPFSLYVFLWATYLLQGLLYKEGSLLSQLLFLLIAFVSIKHFIFLLNAQHKPALLTGLSVMLALFTIYGVVFFLTYGLTVKIYYEELSSINYLKSYFLSILPVFTGYYYAKRGIVDLELMKKIVPFFVIIGVLVFYREEMENMSLLLEKGIYEETITNNAGYFILGILPCSLVYYKKPLFQYLIVIICVVFVLMSMKRGAIFITSLILFYMFFAEFLRGSFKIKTAILIGGAIVICFLLYYISHYLIQNEYFMLRIEETLEGNSSGRDELYSTLANHIMNEMTLFGYLVGEGAMATLKIMGKYAHNDWLEIFTCHGLLGVSLFIYYWHSFLLSSRNKKLDTTSRMVLMSYFIIYLSMTFFSMSIGDMIVFAGLMIGFALANGFENNTKRIVSKI